MNGGFVRLLTTEMCNCLPGQLINQIGVVIIRNVIVVDEFADNVVLKPRLFNHCRFAIGQLTTRLQPLRKQLLIGCLVIHPRHIQHKTAVSASYRADRRNRNARNVDGLLNENLYRFFHHSGYGLGV